MACTDFKQSQLSTFIKNMVTANRLATEDEKGGKGNSSRWVGMKQLLLTHKKKIGMQHF